MIKINKHKMSKLRPRFGVISLTGQLQIFELKQLADMEDRYKSQCKAALESYRHWREQHDQETDMINLVYGALEGGLLRKQAQNAVQAYWTIRHDFRVLFKNYIGQTRLRTPSYQMPLAA